MNESPSDRTRGDRSSQAQRLTTHIPSADTRARRVRTGNRHAEYVQNITQDVHSSGLNEQDK